MFDLFLADAAKKTYLSWQGNKGKQNKIAFMVCFAKMSSLTGILHWPLLKKIWVFR